MSLEYCNAVALYARLTTRCITGVARSASTANLYKQHCREEAITTVSSVGLSLPDIKIPASTVFGWCSSKHPQSANSAKAVALSLCGDSMYVV